MPKPCAALGMRRPETSSVMPHFVSPRTDHMIMLTMAQASMGIPGKRLP